ncbi:hypothetical protein [Streptomyces ureilyticus]|uniref:Prepilin type IV endopeptidase peptidase domain-containing protein n=1 Tax=Streptomyces ureilyticus TaxID=1775131 RepID=A0ABX0E3J8_9ACTN|nr:hypothetical protein [Streptomyces ureilyticus]NGO48786.1 hypothetical protein [Streptomyces ureilyticus]
MREVMLTAGLAGALLCLAGHLPGPVRRWGPQSLALSSMALMSGDRGRSAACVIGAACLWSVVRACVDRRGWDEVTDLAAMALLMVLMTSHSGGSPTHMAAGMVAGPAALTVVVWVTARAAGIMFGQLSDRSAGPDAVPCTRRAWAYREPGAALMIISMAAMFV